MPTPIGVGSTLLRLADVVLPSKALDDAYTMQKRSGHKGDKRRRELLEKHLYSRVFHSISLPVIEHPEDEGFVKKAPAWALSVVRQAARGFALYEEQLVRIPGYGDRLYLSMNDIALLKDEQVILNQKSSNFNALSLNIVLILLHFIFQSVV